jgi:putative ABC transport system substrate-binding protein
MQTDQLKRREFITLLGGAAATWPLAARAHPERMRSIAWFGLGRADVPSPYLDALRSGLHERGWVQGRNIKINAYWATGQQDMDAVAHTLATSNPEVIITQEADDIPGAVAQHRSFRRIRNQR